jgi:hypothetical protein
MNDLWTNYEWMMNELQVMLVMVMFIDTNICESCFIIYKLSTIQIMLYIYIYILNKFYSKRHSNKMIISKKKRTIIPNIT